jgi:hypothetical protein
MAEGFSMRLSLFLLSGSVLFALQGCSKPQPAPQPESAPVEYKLTATVKDIMDGIVDPNADIIWDSFETVVTEKGVEEHAPKTDEEWAVVRHGAVTLAEATNLLLMPGRRVAKPGEKAFDLNIDLPPEEIQTLIDQDRAKWMTKVHALHDVAEEALRAVDARDHDAVLVAGNKIDTACGDCHNEYWYPKEAQRIKAKEQDELKKRQQVLEEQQKELDARKK